MRLTRRAVAATVGWCAATVASIAVAYLALHPLLAAAVPDEVSGLPSVRFADQGVASAPVASPSAAPSRTPSRAASPTTAAPRRSSTIVDGWTATTDANGVVTYLRSFRTQGGDTVLRIVQGEVKLVTATPRSGYRVEPQQTRPDRLVVYFVGAEHASIVDAMWWQARPYAEVSESGKNG